MKAIVINDFGGPEVLARADVETPGPKHGEVLVQVNAVGVNRADILQRRGRYPAPPGVPKDIPGLEYAGVIVETGEGCRRRRVGDRIMGLVGGGACAEYLTIHEDENLSTPPAWSDEEAAAQPEAWFTAFDALERRCRTRRGSVLLVHAVGGGVGLATLQLARRLDCTVIGTSRTAAKLERARAWGLQHAIIPHNKRFSTACLDLTEGRGVDVLVDFIGAAYLEENIRSLAECGQMVIIGLLGGVKATLPLHLVVGRRLSLHGTVLRSRPHREKALLTRAFERHVLPDLIGGRLKKLPVEVMAMEEIGRAHQRIEDNDVFGKIVLKW